MACLAHVAARLLGGTGSVIGRTLRLPALAVAPQLLTWFMVLRLCCLAAGLGHGRSSAASGRFAPSHGF